MFLKTKKINLSTVKNIRNDIYFNAVNLIEHAVLIDNIEMIEIIIEVNSKSRAIKY